MNTPASPPRCCLPVTVLAVINWESLILRCLQQHDMSVGCPSRPRLKKSRVKQKSTWPRTPTVRVSGVLRRWASSYIGRCHSSLAWLRSPWCDVMAATARTAKTATQEKRTVRTKQAAVHVPGGSRRNELPYLGRR
eukprot:scaffold13986_cov58-Cyclotella_meneghiniana.AAC.4